MRISIRPIRKDREGHPLTAEQHFAGAGGRAGDEANLGAPGDGQTMSRARCRAGGVQAGLCPPEEADQEAGDDHQAGVGAVGDDAMEGPADKGELVEAYPMTPARNPRAPINAKYEKHMFARTCPTGHGVRGS